MLLSLRLEGRLNNMLTGLRSLAIALPAFSFFCSHAQISVPSNLCIDQVFRVEHTENAVQNISWDFCEGDLLLNPTISQGTSSDFNIPVGTSLIQSNGNWFGFICSLTNNSLFRLDFGPSLSNSSPQVVNLGNLGGLLNSPQDIEVVEFNSKYYAFVFNRSVNKLIRIDLGTDIESADASSSVVLGGTGFTNGGLDVQFDDLNWIVSITNANTITIVNLGDSPENSPAPQAILNTSVIPGINSIGDLKFVKDGDVWLAFVVGYTSRTVHRLYFGSSLFVDPTSISVTSFQFAPYGLVIERDNGKWIMIVSTLQGNILRLDFGSSLSNTNPLYTNLGKLGGLNNLLKIDIANSLSRWFALTTDWNSKNYFIIEFPQSICSLGKEASLAASETLRSRESGTLNISLYEKLDNGLSNVYTAQIVVLNKEAPYLDFTTNSVCQDSEGIFSPTSNQPLVSVSWNFDVYGTSTELNPVIGFNSPGLYPIQLDGLSDNGCYNLLVKEIEIYPSISGAAEFALPTTLLCTNTALLFPTTTPDIYDGNLSYQWFVDDSPVSTERDLQYTFTDTGPKEIKLMTSIPGCADEITKTTASVEAGPVVDFSFTGTCEDETFSFQNETSGSAESYQWNFDNGQTATTVNASQRFNEPGDFSVSLTAINAVGCENVKTRTLRVHSKPLIDFLVDGPPNACSGVNTDFRNQTVNPDGSLITEWLWAFGDATPPLQQNTGDAQHLFANGGTYHVTLTATTEYGCAGTGEKSVIIHQAPSTSYASTPACDDVPVVFTGPVDNSISSLYWEIGTSYYDGPSVTHTFKSPGDYPLYLELAGSNGCITTVTRTIHVPAPLVPDFSVLKNCVGQETIFTDITSGSDPVSSREWRFQSGEAFSSSPLIRTFGALGEYDVTLQVTAASGCVYDITKEVQVLSPPAAAFAADPASGAYPLEVSFVNTSVQATHYLWEFSDGTGATSTERSPVHTYPEAGTFPVKLVASNDQQCESVAIANVTIVAPLPDADIELLALSSNPDGSLKLIATIHNKGNTILKDLPMEIDLSGKLSLRHVVGEPILPGTKYNAVLGAGILDPGNLDYICVVIDVAHDLNPTFNKVCQDLKDQSFVFPAYPNPATELLNIEWIAEGRKTVVISLADAMGRKVCSVETSGGTGLNRWSLDLRGLENGVYLLLIDDGRLRSSQKILVINKP